MAEAFGIARHELVSLDFRYGSPSEVSQGRGNVCFRGQSGSRFQATGLPILAITGQNLITVHLRVPYRH